LGFYAAFPLLIAAWERTWWWKLALTFVSTAVLVTACEFFAIPGAASASPLQINRAGFLYVHPFARIAEFALGMATALAWKRAGKREPSSATAATVLEVLCIAACAGAITLLASRSMLRAHLPDALAAYVHHCAAAPAFAVLIFVFATGRGWIARFFATPVLVLLGEISFSIYLLHQIFLRALLPWKAQLLGAGAGEAALYTAYWAVLLGTSWAVWRWVERPFRFQLLRLAPARVA
jgi:peptidoglycan/LPS O-acetylase OafA/YrhL